MIPTASRDERPVGAFYWNGSGDYSHSCDRCGRVFATNADRPAGKCPDCRSLARYEENAHLRATAVDLRREGKTLTEIGRELGVSRSTAADWIREEMQYAEDVA